MIQNGRLFGIICFMIAFPLLISAQQLDMNKECEVSMKIRQEKSWVTQLIENTMKRANVKEGNPLYRFINEMTRTTPARPPQSMFLKFDIQIDELFGRNVWNIEPRTELSDKIVIYLHGGSYKYNFMPPHWTFISHISDYLKTRVIAPDYPLAPEYHATDVFALLLNIYSKLIKEGIDPKNISIIGDSAGGGMTLALGQFIREMDLPQPEQLIMPSPCVDVTMSNPEIKEIDKDDPILNIDSIKVAGKEYAGHLDTKHYLVSPIYGDLTGLAPMSLYVGTHDLLVADCRKLYCMVTDLGIEMNYYEYEGLFHVGMLYPTPEAKEIREKIIADLAE